MDKFYSFRIETEYINSFPLKLSQTLLSRKIIFLNKKILIFVYVNEDFEYLMILVHQLI